MIHCRPEEDKKISQTVTIPRTDLEALEKELQDLKNQKDINIMIYFRNNDFRSHSMPVTHYTLDSNRSNDEIKKFIGKKLNSQIDEHYNQILKRKNEIIQEKNEIIKSLQTKLTAKKKWSFWSKD
jgi:hypothetical protein